MKITCLSLNFENQRLEKCSSFLWCCLYAQQGFITSYPAADFLKSASKAYNEAFEYLTSECWPGFNLLPHSSHRKQPGCHTLPREFLCSAAKTHKHITNLTARCCYFCTKKSPTLAAEFGWSKVVYRFCTSTKELFCNLLAGFRF